MINELEMNRHLRTMYRADDVFEVCVFATKGCARQLLTGYFDVDHLPALTAALSAIGSYDAVYVTLNPVNRELLDRAKYEFKAALRRTSDADIAELRHLLVDLDPVRPSGTPSSEGEHAGAIQLATHVKEVLSAEPYNWPAPMVLDSGNGAHLIYKISLNPAEKDRVKCVLEALHQAYSDDKVKVDVSVSNPARLTRLAGTWNRKGNEAASQRRLHRGCQILEMPESLKTTPRAQLELLASEAKSEGTPHESFGTFDYTGALFSIDDFMGKHFPAAKPIPYQGGRKWVLDVCPFNSEHTNKSAVVIERESGQLAFKCHHNGCAEHSWRELRQLLEPRGEVAPPPAPPEVFECPAEEEDPGYFSHTKLPVERALTRLEQQMTSSEATLLTLDDLTPNPPPAIISGLLREQEIGNIVAPPKVGKTWLIIGLALALAAGREWMGKPCRRTKVLVIDNELKPAILRERYHRVATMMGLRLEDLQGWLFFKSHRGNLRSLDQYAKELEEVKSRGIGVVIIDALYRALPKGVDENSNSQILSVYNLLDQYAMAYGCSFILVHHTSKGTQEGKSLTDVGSGAGVQSRAADTHLALLPHKSVSNAVVVHAATRSFPPMAPFCLRRDDILWKVDAAIPVNENSPQEPRKLVQGEVAEVLANLGGSATLTTLSEALMQRSGCDFQSATDKIDRAVLAGRIFKTSRISKMNKPYKLFTLQQSA